jgi:hypothetical protein
MRFVSQLRSNAMSARQSLTEHIEESFSLTATAEHLESVVRTAPPPENFEIAIERAGRKALLAAATIAYSTVALLFTTSRPRS